MFESYKNGLDLRVVKFALIVLVGLVLFVTLIQLTCRTPEDDEVLIRRSEALTAHDDFCMSLPRPADFELRYRSIGGNGYTTAISYTFASRLLFKDVRDFFSAKLTSKGWVLTDLYLEDMTPVGKHVTYQKDQYEITIGPVSAGSSDTTATYYVHCAKKHS